MTSTPTGTGSVILAATPIGNISDATPRLLEALQTADVVAAEDTRRCHALCAALGIKPGGKVISHFDHNEGQRVAELLDVVRGGGTVLVVSDAGMPTVSDPGFVLTAAAVDAALPVTVIPGPSAVLTALALSGLPTDRFCFDGFLPRKSGERRQALQHLTVEPRTTIFFESPHRLADTLQDIADVLGEDRPIAVCRELTKTFEEVRRGPVGTLLGWAQEGVRGEITLVVQGAAPNHMGESDAAAMVKAGVASGRRLKDVCKDVASLTGLTARELYEAHLSQDRS